jgi:hypothetical protein
LNFTFNNIAADLVIVLAVQMTEKNQAEIKEIDQAAHQAGYFK